MEAGRGWGLGLRQTHPVPNHSQNQTCGTRVGSGNGEAELQSILEENETGSSPSPISIFIASLPFALSAHN